MDDERTSARPPGAGRLTWLVGGSIAIVLVLIAAASVILSTDREDASYPSDSPEAALQGYFRAWQAGDIDAAYAALSIRARARVPRQEFRHAQTWQGEARVRVWIDERTGTTERAVLNLTLEERWDGLLRPARDTTRSRVTMIREDGDWKIDTPLAGYYPW
jgi:hypothetical protein